MLASRARRAALALVLGAAANFAAARGGEPAASPEDADHPVSTAHPALSPLQQKIRMLAARAKGKVGVACSLPGVALDCDLNPNETPPMQSLFKLPLALAVLHRIETGSLSLEELMHFGPDDRILPATHSSLQDQYPEADVEVSIGVLLRLAVAQSDNVAADLLLRVAGGPQALNDYLAGIGISGFHLQDSEHALHRDVRAQYRNWLTPASAVELLRRISDKPPLSAAHNEALLSWLRDSVKPRLSADLPAGTPLAHKAGTSGVDAGIAHATNDIGLITLPNGKVLAIAVFITDSRADEDTRDAVIAQIARAIYDESVKP
jgi:beta-lactamase class A